MIKQEFLVNPNADREELDEVTEAVGSMTLTSQQIFALGQTRDPLATLEHMKARRQQVMEIEKGIVTLNQMFVDLSNMVEAQQELLDNLEDFVDTACDYMEVAEEHMEEAVELQRNVRRKKCSII